MKKIIKFLKNNIFKLLFWLIVWPLIWIGISFIPLYSESYFFNSFRLLVFSLIGQTTNNYSTVVLLICSTITVIFIPLITFLCIKKVYKVIDREALKKIWIGTLVFLTVTSLFGIIYMEFRKDFGGIKSDIEKNKKEIAREQAEDYINISDLIKKVEKNPQLSSHNSLLKHLKTIQEDKYKKLEEFDKYFSEDPYGCQIALPARNIKDLIEGTNQINIDNLIKGFYFSFVVASTLGLGDYYPETRRLRIIIMLHVLINFAIVFNIVAAIKGKNDYKRDQL